MESQGQAGLGRVPVSSHYPEQLCEGLVMPVTSFLRWGAEILAS